MAASYAFAVGNIRAREVALLQQQDMEQLLALGDVAQVRLALRDKGYGDTAAPSGSVSDLLRAETNKMWEYLRSVTPDFSLYDALLIRNDLHNTKAAVKGALSGKDITALLMTPSLVAPEEIGEAIKNNRFDRLPPWLSAAAQRAYTVLAHTADAQLSDAILDRAAMAAMATAADKTRVPLLINYISALIFYTNAKIALRAARAGKTVAYLKEALYLPDNKDPDGWISAAAESEDTVLSLLERLDRFGSRAAAEAYRLSPSDFERCVDDELMMIAKEGRHTTLGAEPLLGYLFAKEAEIRDLNILISGLRAGQAPEAIRERMRNLYV